MAVVAAPARWADFGRAAFVAPAGSREAPFLEVAADELPLRGFDRAAVAALEAGPFCDIGEMEIGISGPGIRLRSVVAVMAWMAAPKGSVKACATRRRAPEKVYTVLWGHESAKKNHEKSHEIQRYRNTASPSNSHYG